MENTPKVNNFDLIRLFAALQVAVHHSAAHLNLNSDHSAFFRAFFALTSLFPGVPVFFFISGFLISQAFENNPVPLEYARNRILRIYPALLCCFVVSAAMVGISGYRPPVRPALHEVLLWVLAQVSIGQFYNPEFLRDYGVGVLNGSVWTITVELQFYVLVPILYAMLALRAAPQARSNLGLWLLTLLFLVINQAYVLATSHHSGELWFKFVGVTFLPWFYMFLAGVLAQKNFSTLRPYLAGKFLAVLAAYCALAWPLSSYFGWGLGNNLGPLFLSGLGLLAIAAAFSRPELSDLLLRRNDLSYGVYLYHMPVVNLLLALGLGSTPMVLAAAIGATLLLALGSWVVIEKPALRLKRHALYKHTVGTLGHERLT
jgi:peptidoglycan/LPS O-acetylase OafA/YrhL